MRIFGSSTLLLSSLVIFVRLKAIFPNYERKEQETFKWGKYWCVVGIQLAIQNLVLSLEGNPPWSTVPMACPFVMSLGPSRKVWAAKPVVTAMSHHWAACHENLSPWAPPAQLLPQFRGCLLGNLLMDWVWHVLLCLWLEGVNYGKIHRVA